MLDHHWVIVDEVRVNVVLARDPAGLPGEAVGFEGTMVREVFEDQWRFGMHQAVYKL
jgi:hypothetical protein